MFELPFYLALNTPVTSLGSHPSVCACLALHLLFGLYHAWSYTQEMYPSVR